MILIPSIYNIKLRTFSAAILKPRSLYRVDHSLFLLGDLSLWSLGDPDGKTYVSITGQW